MFQLRKSPQGLSRNLIKQPVTKTKVIEEVSYEPYKVQKSPSKLPGRNTENNFTGIK